MRRQVPLAALIVLMLAATPATAAPQCGPFGDSPAEVNHGWFASFVTDHSPVCFGGRILGPWTDPGGSARYACLFEPRTVSKETQAPLLVFLHGSLSTADSLIATNLRGFVGWGDLGGAKPGYILLAPEGRFTTHFYPGFDANALGWDNWYRQLDPSGAVKVGGESYAENAEAATVDHFIAEEVSSGKVDNNRIYLSGWSNGAALALLYTLNRPTVAAAAVYSSPDPFGAFYDPCGQTPVNSAPSDVKQIRVFNPHAQLMHVRNSCDIAGLCPNGDKFAADVRKIGATLDDVLLDSSGHQVSECDATCGTDPSAGKAVGVSGGVRGFVHHLFWPKAWTLQMFEFLKAHPLSSVTQVNANDHRPGGR